MWAVTLAWMALPSITQVAQRLLITMEIIYSLYRLGGLVRSRHPRLVMASHRPVERMPAWLQTSFHKITPPCHFIPFPGAWASVESHSVMQMVRLRASYPNPMVIICC